MSDKRPGFLLVANWPSDVGFAWWLMESYWAKLAHHYADRFRFVLTFPEVREIPQVIQDAPIEIIEMNFGRQSVDNDLSLLGRFNIEAIYFSDRAVINTRYARYRFAGVQSIITHDHTPGQRTPPIGLKRLAKWVLARTPGIVSDTAIGATEFVRQRIRDTILLPEAKCFAVPNGLRAKTEQAVEDPAKRFGLDRAAVHMVMTARANPYKGLRFIVETLANYRSQPDAVDLQFTLLGDGPMLSELKQLASDLGIADACHFPGYVNNVNELLPGFDFAIHPSKGEVGYSLAILEYMRAGLATIVPDNPSVCGATRHDKTGLYFREGDRDSFRGALARLAEDPTLRERMGREAETDEANLSLNNAHRLLIEAVDATLKH